MLNSAPSAGFTDVRTDYYPAATARRDRRDQRARLAEHQQRRLSRRLRDRRRRPTRRRSARCSRRSTRSSSGSRAQRYLVGQRRSPKPTGGCSRTLIRFDAVYIGHFKCNLRRIVDYPNLSNYLRDLYQVPGVAETVNIDHIKRHYYGSHRGEPDRHRAARDRSSISPRRTTAPDLAVNDRQPARPRPLRLDVGPADTEIPCCRRPLSRRPVR